MVVTAEGRKCVPTVPADDSFRKVKENRAKGGEKATDQVFRMSFATAECAKYAPPSCLIAMPVPLLPE